MARVTPALDRLTEKVHADFLRNITQPEMMGPGLRTGMSMGQMLAARAAALAATSSYLQLGSLVTMAVPRLYAIDRELRARLPEEQILARTMEDPALEGVGPEITENVRALLGDVEGYITGLVADTMRGLSDADVGTLLVELWHIDEEEFGRDVPGNEIDFNASDPMPERFENPRTYLLDLILETIITRLVKRHGPELLLAWADAVAAAHR